MSPKAKPFPATENCPHPEWWFTVDERELELQVAELVAAFIRALQPRFALETHLGDGSITSAISRSLVRNGHGLLVSLAPGMDRRPGMRYLARDESAIACDVLPTPALEYTPSQLLDFAWINPADPIDVVEEFNRFEPWFHDGTIVGFPRTARGFGNLRLPVSVLESRERIRSIHLQTPWGVTFANVLTATSRWEAPPGAVED